MQATYPQPPFACQTDGTPIHPQYRFLIRRSFELLIDACNKDLLPQVMTERVLGICSPDKNVAKARYVCVRVCVHLKKWKVQDTQEATCLSPSFSFSTYI